MKHCGRCNTDKDESAFNKGQSWCAKCMAAYKKERRDKERGAPPREVWREYTGEIVTCRQCGERKPLTPENFRPGNRASQSHIRKECRSCSNKSRREYNHRTPEIRAYYKLFQYRKADERKGLNTDLTTEDVLRLTSQPCAYCGFTGDNGADRLDNAVGHTKDNCVPCCVECNIARGDRFTPDEMKKYIGPAIAAVRKSRQ